jgi:hypothetical protein
VITTREILARDFKREREAREKGQLHGDELDQPARWPGTGRRVRLAVPQLLKGQARRWRAACSSAADERSDPRLAELSPRAQGVGQR